MKKHALTGFGHLIYPIFKDSKRAVERITQIVDFMDQNFHKNHVYFGTGTSGAIILTLINHLFNRNIVLVNKGSTHHRMIIEGKVNGNSINHATELYNRRQEYHFVFIDDFLNTGATAMKCLHTVLGQASNLPLDLRAKVDVMFDAVAILSKCGSNDVINSLNDYTKHYIQIED